MASGKEDAYEGAIKGQVIFLKGEVLRANKSAERDLGLEAPPPRECRVVLKKELKFRGWGKIAGLCIYCTYHIFVPTLHCSSSNSILEKEGGGGRSTIRERGVN